MSVHVHPLDAQDVLRAISARGCENSTRGIGSCFSEGRTALARFGAETACHPCLAWAALLPDVGGEAP